MIDPALLRRAPEAVRANLARRGAVVDLAVLAVLDERRRAAQLEAEQLRALRNERSREVGEARRRGEEAAAAVREVEDVKKRLQLVEEELTETQSLLRGMWLEVPNLLHDSVPDGRGEGDNAEVRRWGEAPVFAFEARDHVALGEAMGMMDFGLSAKLASARFVTMFGPVARLHRALAQFMLDLHITRHGYREAYMPFLANPAALTGTGQLPKFEDDLFRAERDQLYLIPTAEVALTNVVRDSVVAGEALPMKLVCHSPCFRREAGSYGRDVRGMLRQHQFEKVELVHIVAPEQSYAALEELTAHAEAVLQTLGLPYRTVALCAGDMGFAAAKTYDIEVWLPGQNAYREISSCSNCEDFQARRMLGRFRGADGKPALVHTLNGSGVAVGRALIAVMENYQEADGSVVVPEPLRSYMGCDRIGGEA